MSVQLIHKDAYHSCYRDKHTELQHGSILGPLAPQLHMLTTYDIDAVCFFTASKTLSLAVSELHSVQPQIASSDMSQSKIHIRVCGSCRLRLVEYFQLIPPSDLESDDVGKMLCRFHKFSAVISRFVTFCSATKRPLSLPYTLIFLLTYLVYLYSFVYVV